MLRFCLLWRGWQIFDFLNLEKTLIIFSQLNETKLQRGKSAYARIKQLSFKKRSEVSLLVALQLRENFHWIWFNLLTYINSNTTSFHFRQTKPPKSLDYISGNLMLWNKKTKNKSHSSLDESSHRISNKMHLCIMINCSRPLTPDLSGRRATTTATAGCSSSDNSNSSSPSSLQSQHQTIFNFDKQQKVVKIRTLYFYAKFSGWTCFASETTEQVTGEEEQQESQTKVEWCQWNGKLCHQLNDQNHSF